MNWHTGAFAVIFLIAVNGAWIYLCQTGTAQKYMEQVAFIAYIGFVFLGALTLLIMELFYRYGKERLDRVRELENKVEQLVALLDVKYGAALEKAKHGGHLLGDRLDDATDFMGLTEASSDDDVTCVEAVRCKAPKKKEGLKPGTTMSTLKAKARETKPSKT
jgi:hypothetical protein